MKFLCLLLISCSLTRVALGQPDSIVTTTADTSAVYNFVVLDSRYQSQFSFWGRNYDQKTPLTVTNLMYYFHSGVWMSASDYLFFDQTIPTQFGVTLGYFKEVNPKVDWHLSYSQFYVPSGDIPAGYRSQGYAQTTLAFDWGVLFTGLQAHTLLNKQSDVFFTLTNSRYFQFNRPLWKKVKVSFEPKTSLTLGTHRFEYVNGLVIGPGGGIITQPNSSEIDGTKIQMLNWDFSFPLKFEGGYFSIESSWKFSKPLNVNPDYSSKGLNIFTVAMNYSIPLKKS